jgi:hypothetical protein
MNVLNEHVEGFNAGVRSGDFGVAGYAWRRRPDKRAGELRLTVDGALITRLVVTFD